MKAELDDPGDGLADFPVDAGDAPRGMFRKIPSLTDIALVVGSRTLWDLTAHVSSWASAFKAAAENKLAICDAAARVEESSVVVDSSKYPLPMKALYLAAPGRVRVVYLVRDGRGVSRSIANRKDMGFEAAVRHWGRYTVNLELALKTVPPASKTLLRYEDLCLNPKDELARISRFAGLESPIEPAPLEKESCHDIGGNPMRHRHEETEIRLDEKWRSDLTPEQLSLFDRVGGRVNRRLGYH